MKEYLLMTGLYENINAIQNNPKLTFLLRSPKISLEPLGLSQIARQYEKTLNLSMEEARYLSKITKGYAFAFQALGMLYWDEAAKNKKINRDSILRELEILLDEYVYQKIWDGLSEQDQRILRCLPEDGAIKTGEICEQVELSTQSFSKYRERLINKGLIQSAAHGNVELTLPRFAQVIRYYD